MSFPFDTESLASEREVILPYEYGINFDTGRLTGKMVEKEEAIKVWIYNALRTARYRFVIYSWDYGNELEDLVGKAYTMEYLQTECKRRIEDCLSMNENILAISNFSAVLDKDKLNISFTANTLYGEVEINV